MGNGYESQRQIVRPNYTRTSQPQRGFGARVFETGYRAIRRHLPVPLNPALTGTRIPTFPLAKTVADITAATATGTGGTGGGPIYQEFYAIVLTLTSNSTEAQSVSVAICGAFASAYNPVFTDLSTQDNLMGTTINEMLGQV